MSGKPEQLKRDGTAFLISLTLRYPRLVLAIVGLALLATLVSSPAPYLGKIIIDDIIFRQMNADGRSTVSGFMGVPMVVWMLGGVVLVGVGLKLLGTIVYSWQSHYILQITRNVLNEVRLDTAVRLMGAPQKFYESTEPGRIAARLTHDVFGMDGTIFSILRLLVPAVITVVVVVGFMVFINAWLTAIVMVTMPLTAFLTWLSYRRLHAFAREESDRAAALNATATEIFSSVKIIRVFTAEPFFLDRLRQRCEAVRFEGIRHWTIFHTVAGLLGMLSGIGADIFLFVGGIMAIYGHITFGEFFAFYAYQGMLWGPINTLLNAGVTMQQGTANAEKVKELMDVEQEPWLARAAATTSDDQEEPPPFRGQIEARNLMFSYAEGDPVLQEVNLTIAPGTMTALVGQSGSGKTTFASLLMGLYLPTGGKLLIDGNDLRNWDLRRLRRNIGVVLQDAVLFNDTLRGNLCLGRPFSDEQIWAALAAAHLSDTIRQMPEGLDSQVGISGTRLSGGQRQRLAIARVFLRDPSFIILDEATSALDSETEKAIQRSFDALLANRTSVVIAHRLSTIYRADQIVVMHQGRVAEVGRHEDLVQRADGLYRQLYEAQVEGMVPMSGVHRRPFAQTKS
ncbi:MAG: ABC transporter ATP-binding protein/permease [Planctomycetes bacterium]|jgi:ATP-binding cassette subfamily C protein|nr:ABC transporter ATP-binding protein/permease [Planctomycetota bacterium]